MSIPEHIASILKSREFDAKSAKFRLVVLDEILFFTRVEAKDILKVTKELKRFETSRRSPGVGAVLLLAAITVFPRP